jgi:hypothetical protein
VEDAATDISTDGADVAATDVDVDVESDATTDLGITEGAEDAEVSAADEPRYAIKVKGEERELSVSELVALAQKGDDYTRKTQELAAEREQLSALKALQQALESDPLSAIEALRSIYELDAESDTEDDDLDPTERRLAELERREQRREERARQEAIVAEATSVAADAGLAVGAEELLAFAVENEIGSLKTAARLMKAEQKREDEAAKTAVVEAKRKAAVVTGGATRAPGSATSAPKSKPSLAEAFAFAKKQHS